MILAVVSALSVGCANTPAYRSVGPPMTGKAFEAGGAIHGVVGQNVSGVGTTVWAQGQVAQDILLVGRGHFTELIPYTGPVGIVSDAQFGGNGGLRGIYRVSEDLFIGGEVTLDYLQLRSSNPAKNEIFVSGVASFPVAERALPDVWIYVQPTLGAGFRYGNDDDIPFGGFMEVPLGVAYQYTDTLVFTAEGGFAIPFNGGYLGVGASFRL